MDFFEGVDAGTWYELGFQRNNRLSWLIPVLQAVSFLGAYPTLAVVVLVAVVVLLAQHLYRAALWYAAICLVGAGVVEMVKVLVARDRPSGWTGYPGTLYSFPSAHALVGTVVYVGLALLLAASLCTRGRLLLVGSAVLLAVLIGGSQLFLGNNYLTDVLAGWLGAAVVLLLAPRAEPPAVPVPQPQGPPHE